MNWSRENIAWAAGIIEGEGCITHQVTTKRSKGYDYWQLRVSSTDYDVLLRLKTILGFGRIYRQRRLDKQHKPTWQWTVYRQPDLYAVLAAIFSFMCARRQNRIGEAIRTMSARSPWRPSRREPILEREKADLEFYYQTLSASRP